MFWDWVGGNPAYQIWKEVFEVTPGDPRLILAEVQREAVWPASSVGKPWYPEVPVMGALLAPTSLQDSVTVGGQKGCRGGRGGWCGVGRMNWVLGGRHSLCGRLPVPHQHAGWRDCEPGAGGGVDKVVGHLGFPLFQSVL